MIIIFICRLAQATPERLHIVFIIISGLKNIDLLMVSRMTTKFENYGSGVW